MSTFIFSKRVKIFARAIGNIFRTSPKSSFSIWCLILPTICAIRSKAPSLSSSPISPASEIKSLVSSSSASSKRYVRKCVYSISYSISIKSFSSNSATSDMFALLARQIGY